MSHHVFTPSPADALRSCLRQPDDDVAARNSPFVVTIASLATPVAIRSMYQHSTNGWNRPRVQRLRIVASFLRSLRFAMRLPLRIPHDRRCDRYGKSTSVLTSFRPDSAILKFSFPFQ